MWYACTSTQLSDHPQVCTFSFAKVESLWKHIEANIIYFTDIAHHYEVFKDGSLQYSIDLRDFPLKRSSRIPGLIIGILLIITLVVIAAFFFLRFVV